MYIYIYIYIHIQYVYVYANILVRLLISYQANWGTLPPEPGAMQQYGPSSSFKSGAMSGDIYSTNQEHLLHSYVYIYIYIHISIYEYIYI